jgi:hypothetical protein
MVQFRLSALYSRGCANRFGALTMAKVLVSRILLALLLAAPPAVAEAQAWGSSSENGRAPTAASRPSVMHDKFRQLEEILPTPNGFRTASGAPGPSYWQQRADYQMDIELDDVTQTLKGKARIAYRNNSPDSLTYLWLQLDQNLFNPESTATLTEEAPEFEKMPYRTLARLLYVQKFRGGITVSRVADGAGKTLHHTVVKTMMRVDLEKPLPPGQSFTFEVEWSYPIHDAIAAPARTGYEYFAKDGNYLYEIAQFFPRMAAYTDVTGWQHKQFLGRGEFTLEFGDYQVRLTVPDDHVVAATGVLQNPEQVLSEVQRRRLREAASAKAPVYVVTPEEAEANEKNKPAGKKTWVFHAENVRDFAFASSRKFVWDAWGHDSGRKQVLAMSFYPKEATVLWSKYSTHAIVHTLNVYSRYTFDYPYPVAISVNGPARGMEYPMICFNGPRNEEDGTYFGMPKEDEARRFAKYPLISVVIHEVGHNYFPMIVNSDERQWTWLDEGINSFLQFLAEQEWEENYPSRRGEAAKIVEYMSSAEQVPIMTDSDSLLQFSNNSYAKPATALNILRETVLGRELFDFAFKEFARRWKFKRPMPADLFRTLEDASGVDLDWFWHGWFYTNDHVDISLDAVRLYTLDSRDPVIEKGRLAAEKGALPPSVTEERNQGMVRRVDQVPELKDFYNSYDPHAVTDKDRKEFEKLLGELQGFEKDLLKTEAKLYVIELSNRGGLVMPVLLDIEYADGSKEKLNLPAEIWRYHPDKVEKLLIRQQEIKSIEIDRQRQTADTDTGNNAWPPKPTPTRFQLFKEKMPTSPMKEAQEAEKAAKEGQP